MRVVSHELLPWRVTCASSTGFHVQMVDCIMCDSSLAGIHSSVFFRKSKVTCQLEKLLQLKARFPLAYMGVVQLLQGTRQVCCIDQHG